MKDIVNTELLNKKEYLTIEEMGRTLKCSENTVYRYVNKGCFKPIKYRQRNYFRSSEVQNFLEELFNTKYLSD